MNRVVLAVVFLGVIATGSAFYFLQMRAPDEGRVRSDAANVVRERPPRPDSPSSRDPNVEPAPAAPEPPRAPAPTRRATPDKPEATAPAPARETATLRVTSDVAGAQVFLNREFVGATPVSADGLAPGSYQVNVSAPGFDNHVETVELTPGEREITIRFREVRLNASISVVHKHRFGSCTGTLIATPQGIRYETANKDDGFQASLRDLETFEVNYLEKNLRIQPRKGRRYDFTDPAGNADNLFVFHRDVDRARERLTATHSPPR